MVKNALVVMALGLFVLSANAGQVNTNDVKVDAIKPAVVKELPVVKLTVSCDGDCKTIAEDEVLGGIGDGYGKQAKEDGLGLTSDNFGSVQFYVLKIKSEGDKQEIKGILVVNDKVMSVTHVRPQKGTSEKLGRELFLEVKKSIS